MNTSNKILIVIPARYESKRLPGKPLMLIAGKTLLERVCEVAQQVAQQDSSVEVLVATDDQRIFEHAQTIGVKVVMTPPECPTGTDRVLYAVQQLDERPKAVINLQGDSPLTPAKILIALLNKLKVAGANTVVTPAVQLSWQQLDLLRKAKINSPFSGTTAIVNSADEALWFSKQIIPAIRSEANLRANSELSPVLQHLGIYGYTTDILESFSNLKPGYYEELENLEQLRLLENGYTIQVAKVVLPDLNAWRGVDTAEDAKFVEQLLIGGK